MWPETKPIITDLSEHEVIEIIGVSDPHFGNECFDTSRWNRLTNYILEKPNRYVIWAGDMMENAVPGSKGDPLTQTMSPHEQKEFVVATFKQFKDRTLAIVDGNHEYNRSTRMAGLYPLYDAACIAGIEDKYRSAFAVADIKVGHGSNGSAKRPHTFVGYVCHKLKELKSFSTANQLEGFDFVIGGHDHEPHEHPRSKICYNPITKKVMYGNTELVDCGSNLFYGGYGARGAMGPKSTKMYKIVCYGRGRDKAIETLGFYI